MTIDRNDAPEGYEARIAGYSCNGCAFWPGVLGACESRLCVASRRADEQNVIFVKRKPRLVATGGRRPTPPEWASGVRFHKRDGSTVTFGLADLWLISFKWKRRGDLRRGLDILFVEWLP